MMVMALPGSLLDNGSVYIYHQNESYMYSSAEYKNMMIGALYRDQDSSSIALLVLYVLVFFLAVISNVLVILVIYRFQHLRRFVIGIFFYSFRDHKSMSNVY